LKKVAPVTFLLGVRGEGPVGGALLKVLIEGVDQELEGKDHPGVQVKTIKGDRKGDRRKRISRQCKSGRADGAVENSLGRKEGRGWGRQ